MNLRRISPAHVAAVALAISATLLVLAVIFAAWHPIVVAAAPVGPADSPSQSPSLAHDYSEEQFNVAILSYRMGAIERFIDKFTVKYDDEHKWLNRLLIGNLATVAGAMVMFIITSRTHRRQEPS